MCFLLLASVLVVGFVAQAQILPVPTTVNGVSTNTQAAVVSPGSTSASLKVVIDSVSNSTDQIEIVTSDPAVLIGLTLPSGIAVSQSNAASLGIGWSTQTFNDFDIDGLDDPFTIPGNHVSIQLPSGSASGTYQIQASGSQLSIFPRLQ